MSFVFTTDGLQSKMVEPRSSFVPGLILVIVSLQNEGSISAPLPRLHKVKRAYLLTLQT